MNIEKWECNKCGSPCRVEIESTDNNMPLHLKGQPQFRGLCIAGNKDYPEDPIPFWEGK